MIMRKLVILASIGGPWNRIHAIVALFLMAGLSIPPTAIGDQAIPLDGRGGGIISFNSDRDGNGEIYVMNADGSGQRNITNHPANDGFGVWSPDGNRMAFVSDRDGSYGIYIMILDVLQNAEFSKPVKISDKRPSSRVSWSPDGSRIIFDAWPERDLFIVNSDGSDLRRLTNTPESEFQPQFSPDGSTIVFCLTADERQNICVMNPDGTGKKKITDDGVSFFPTWSPSGKRIAFNSSRPGRQDIDIAVIDADGSNRKWLTDHPRHDEFPSWSPDGSRIAYQSDRGVHQIFIMNSDGSDNRSLSNNTSYENGEPYWRPSRDDRRRRTSSISPAGPSDHVTTAFRRPGG
jgi:Tol biopolymer transport system component